MWAQYYYTFIFFVAITVFCVGVFWISLYFINRKKINKRTRNINFFPFISIIVPVYNEEKNIGNTLKSIFSNNYPKKKMEVIVIDDGSKDKTSEIASKFPVKLVKYKKNKGKIFALNDGISRASHDIIINTDGDTILEKNTIKLLVEGFKDPGVGSVGGMYKAMKKYSLRKNPFKFILEKLQYLEYLGYSLMRKQQEILESILVIPGAIAAYRKQALLDVGGFDNDTVIEDYDITLKIHKAGYKVRCNKNAVAWVLAPQTIRSLIRQRTRWYRGGVQVLKKHSDLLHTRVGAVTFVWGFDVFNMLLQVVVFLVAASHLVGMLATQSIFEIINMWIMSILYLRFSLLGGLVLMAMLAFVLGIISTTVSVKLHGSSMKKLLLFPVMSVYSIFLSVIFVKSFFQEIFGKKIHFNASLKAEA